MEAAFDVADGLSNGVVVSDSGNKGRKGVQSSRSQEELIALMATVDGCD